MEFTSATTCIDSDHPSIQSVALDLTKGLSTDVEKAVAIYNKVRDGWRYNPYHIHFKEEKLKASYILQKKEGHCIDKAILLIAMARSVGIPARLCLSKVCNHVATEQLEEVLGTNVLVPHGFVELQLEGKWVKATPAFNANLCMLLDVEPLEFNGKEDSIFQEYDREGADFMEYLEYYGHFEDVPIKLMFKLMKQYYPRIFGGAPKSEYEFQEKG